jgi:hypothetical protein
MGQLIYFVNHTKKEFFCPFGSKWQEIIGNPKYMEKILEYIRQWWNGDRIGIINSFRFCRNERFFKSRYKDITEEAEFRYTRKDTEDPLKDGIDYRDQYKKELERGEEEE